MRLPRLLPLVSLATLLLALTTDSARAEPAQREGERRGWSALPLPAVCTAPPEASPFAPLRDGAHLRGPGLEPQPTSPVEALPLPLLASLLEEEARAAGLELELARGGPPLLARGSPEALEFARARLAELDADGRALAIELEALLVPSDAASAPEPWRALVRPGQVAALGRRVRTSFVWDWAVDVAADSAIATPRLGQAASGRTLHLSAWRVEAGARVLVEGLLDVAELVEIASFDPETSDLGPLDQPRVRCAQLAFSGLVGPEEELAIELAGLPLSSPDWRLVVRARSRATPPRPPGAGHALLDLGLVASSPLPLLPHDPGPGLDAPASGDLLGELFEPLAPATLAALAGAGRGAREDGRSFSPPTWVGPLLLVPLADRGTLEAARSLLAAAEAPRVETSLVTLERGVLRARFPAARGRVARLIVGEERMHLVGWAAELAPESWMGAPRVGLVFDGLVVELATAGDALDVRARASASSAPAVAPRTPGGVGRTELVRRSAAASAVRLERGAGASLLELAGEPSLRVSRGP